MPFECQDTFLINFTGSVICTMNLSASEDVIEEVMGDPILAGGANPGPIGITWGPAMFQKYFNFTRGSNLVGSYGHIVLYSVNGTAAVAASPGGVSFIGAHNNTPDFTALPTQVQVHSYSGTVDVTNPQNEDGSANAEGFMGNSLSIEVTIGFTP